MWSSQSRVGLLLCLQRVLHRGVRSPLLTLLHHSSHAIHTGVDLLQPQLLSLFLFRQVLFMINLFPPLPISPDSSCFPSPSALSFRSCPPVGGAEGVCPLFPLCRTEIHQVSVRCPRSSPFPESWASLGRDCCFIQLHRSGSATLLKSGASPIACGKLDLT